MSTPAASGPPGERGSSSICIAIVFPAVAVLVLALVQTVIVSTASAVALSAAEEGLRVARARTGTHGRGHAAAAGFARRFPVLLDPTVAISGTTTITVTVHGHAPSVLPGLHRTITATSRGPRERITTDTGGIRTFEGLGLGQRTGGIR